jgi:pyridoxamine 5'-phosphate oxidase
MSELISEAIATFNALLVEARESGEIEPTAMTVSTATVDGRPSSRTVLLKHADARGFVFFTNYDSHKGGELAENPQAALLLLWKQVRNIVQVRVEGRVEKVEASESDAYFATRPRMSQLGAWASLQSQTLEAREDFESRLADYEREYDGGEVPRPPHWGGYRVVPQRIEFWYGAEFRLHERQCYECVDGTWQKRMLYP